MGGQACVFYGAAEFSRDLDLLILAEHAELERLSGAFEELEAEQVAVPPFAAEYLHRGHAVHFRCKRPEVAGLRIDLMSELPGLEPFRTLWNRRTTIEVSGEPVDLLSLPDLVAAKKTQRDKDWPMIRRLVEAFYFGGGRSAQDVEFLLRELRTPALLIALASEYTDIAARLVHRPAVASAILGDADAVRQELEIEARQTMELDRRYWIPLKRELEELRRTRNRAV